MHEKKEGLTIVPIGGLEQIGANSMMIGCDNEWIILDLGIAFYDKYGIEILVPDISFPLEVRNNIKGILVTHAHEDHIGAIQHLWNKLRIPIYVTEFPAAVLRQKFSECSWGNNVEIHVVRNNDSFRIGEFEIEYVPLAHSIVGSSGVYIKTHYGNIFCSGDWKIDDTPMIGDSINIKRMEKIGKTGVDCLLCDSTNIMNCENDTSEGSEKDVKAAIKKIFKDNKDRRITITLFASNLARMEAIMSVALETGRKVAVIGRSMHKMLDAISKTSYYSSDLKRAVNGVISEEEAADMPPHKVAFLCTGSQGELRSALYKIAKKENRVTKLGKNDVVVFSSKVIPGNELGIRELQNMLVKSGVEIITTELTTAKIHVSGHPNKSAVSNMYKWLQPRSFMPIHGDPCMLRTHEKFAKACGIDETIVAESGDVISLIDGKLSKIGSKKVGLCCIESGNVIPLSSPIVKERAAMSTSGHVSVSFLLNSSSDTLNSSPDVVISGIYITNEIQEYLQTLIYQAITNDIASYSSNADLLIDAVKRSVKRLLLKCCDKKPLVSVHVHRC
ncbi:MAG: ribonuclease J [Holosporales bacterium]|jgi:ribonuclease J|nr:ribonuclease J [Holosporales bacterium]